MVKTEINNETKEFGQHKTQFNASTMERVYFDVPISKLPVIDLRSNHISKLFQVEVSVYQGSFRESANDSAVRIELRHAFPNGDNSSSKLEKAKVIKNDGSSVYSFFHIHFPRSFSHLTILDLKL